MAADPTTPITTTTPSASTTAETTEEQIATTVENISTVAVALTTPTIWAAILGFFTALPALVQFAASVFNWIKTLTGQTPQDLLVNAGKMFDDLAAAQTAQQIQSAEGGIAQSINHLPSK